MQKPACPPSKRQDRPAAALFRQRCPGQQRCMGAQQQRYAVPEGGLADLVVECGHAQRRPGRSPQRRASQQRRLRDAPPMEFGHGLVPPKEEECQTAERAQPNQQLPYSFTQREHPLYTLSYMKGIVSQLRVPGNPPMKNPRGFGRILLTTGKDVVIINDVDLPLFHTCSGIEVVITSTIGNRVTVKSRPRVRIPPTAPRRRKRYIACGGFLHIARVRRFSSTHEARRSRFMSRVPALFGFCATYCTYPLPFPAATECLLSCRQKEGTASAAPSFWFSPVPRQGIHYPIVSTILSDSM